MCGECVKHPTTPNQKNVSRFDIYIYIVRDSFGLDPKTGLGFGPTSPNNKFVKRGRKN